MAGSNFSLLPVFFMVMRDIVPLQGVFFLPCSGSIIALSKLKHSGTALDTPELYNQFVSLIDSRHPPVGVRVGPP